MMKYILLGILVMMLWLFIGNFLYIKEKKQFEDTLF